MDSQEELKETKAVCTWIGWVIRAIFVIVIFDAFMLKYGVNISVILTVDYIVKTIFDMLYDIGYYAIKCMTISKVVVDVLNGAWEIIRMHIPLKEIIQVKNWMYVLCARVFVVCIAWWARILVGMSDASAEENGFYFLLTGLIVGVALPYIGRNKYVMSIFSIRRTQPPEPQ